MVACAICGKENPAGVEYCEDCGAALNATASAPAPALVDGAPEQSPGGAVAPATTAPPASSLEAVPDAIAPAMTVPPESSLEAMPDAMAPVAPLPADGDAATALPTINPRLVVKRYGAVTPEEIPLQGDRLVVGRFDPESGPVDIDLSTAPEAAQLSRHHAELYREADGRWYVKDLGSTNGVFVKRPDSATFGPRLTTPSALTPGDEVAFGNARFIFKAD